jgi:hypothetical protein
MGAQQKEQDCMEVLIVSLQLGQGKISTFEERFKPAIAIVASQNYWKG